MTIVKPHILIVDNEYDWHQQHLHILLNAEFDVAYAEDYDDAIKAIDNALKPFDILITEIRINQETQDEEGFELANYLEEKGTYTQVIILTRYATITNVKRALRQTPKVHDIAFKIPDNGSEFNPNHFLEVVKVGLSKVIDVDVFVLSPSTSNHRETYSLIQETANELGLTCKHSEDSLTTGLIMEQIENNIQRSRIIIADLTDKNPDIYFKTGISDAKGKPVILLAHDDDNLAQNLQGNSFIPYENSFRGPIELKRELKKQIKFIINNDINFKKSHFKQDNESRNFNLVITTNNEEGNDTFKSIIRPAITVTEIEYKYISEFNETTTTKKIQDHLRLADLIITDLTGGDADVYYLSGFAFGLNKYPIILHNEQYKIPSWIGAIGKIPYSKGSEYLREKAKKKLTLAIREHINKKEQGLNKRTIKIFINYASEDELYVQELYFGLKKYPWINPSFNKVNILPGQLWKSTIAETIENVDAVLVCISNISVNKTGYMQAEIAKAKVQQALRPAGKIYMIPVLLEECLIPFGLKDYHPVYMEEPDAIEKIVQSLETLRK